jgi:hypothetical protein
MDTIQSIHKRLEIHVFLILLFVSNGADRGREEEDKSVEIRRPIELQLKNSYF